MKGCEKCKNLNVPSRFLASFSLKYDLTAAILQDNKIESAIS